MRADNATGAGAWSADAAGTPGAVSLTASAVRETTARLTLARHDGVWYHRYTVPAGDTSCTEASGATADLADLSAGTRYTFTAYRDAVCATEIASAAPFLTRPGQVAGVTAAARHQSLRVAWTAAPGAAGYTLQWKSGAQGWEYGGAREATVAGGTTYTIPFPDQRHRLRHPRAGGQRDRRRRLVRGRGRHAGSGDPDRERGGGRHGDPDHREA